MTRPWLVKTTGIATYSPTAPEMFPGVAAATFTDRATDSHDTVSAAIATAMTA
jgi:hypothetical protein